jgi:hypothetical protein
MMSLHAYATPLTWYFFIQGRYEHRRLLTAQQSPQVIECVGRVLVLLLQRRCASDDLGGVVGVAVGDYDGDGADAQVVCYHLDGLLAYVNMQLV